MSSLCSPQEKSEGYSFLWLFYVDANKKRTKFEKNEFLLDYLNIYWIYFYWTGAFRLYDVDNDGFITRDEMYNIVDAIYQMVVSRFFSIFFSRIINKSWWIIWKKKKNRISHRINKNENQIFPLLLFRVSSHSRKMKIHRRNVWIKYSIKWIKITMINWH